MTKRILVIAASPRKGGNSDLLCERFIEGALKAGAVYAVGAWEKGAVVGNPAMDEAYELGLGA